MSEYIANLVQQAKQLLAQRQYQQCHQLCIVALQHDKNHPEVFFLLGLVALGSGNVELGKEHIQQAIDNDPEQLQYHIKLIEVLLATGYLAQAHSAALLAKNCKIVTQHSLNMLGTFFNRLDCHRDALAVYKIAESIDEKSSSVLLFNLATTYKFLGEINTARDYMLQAINAGFQTSSYLPLAELTDKDSLDELEDILLKKQAEYKRVGLHHINIEARANLLFALALCYEKKAQYDLSFEYLATANALKSKQLNYRQETDNALFQALKQRFSSEDSTFKPTAANISKNPIFIVGMPRTGSTLLERMLSAHTDVASAGEIQTMPIEFRRLCKTQSNAHIDADVLAASTGIDFEALAKSYIEELKRFDFKESYIIDKLPYNYLYIGAIKAAFPHAKIIHITRNPLDTCLSNFKQLYAHVYPFSYDLKNIGNYYLNYCSLMAHWDEQFPEQICHVRYESLVENAEAEMLRLLAYCELPWQEECINPQNNHMPVSTASAVQVRQPIYKTSMYRWKNYQEHLKPLIDLFAEHHIECE